ncbi:MAG: hypothetical protein RL441_1132 [Actinomycetota bacterium]
MLIIVAPGQGAQTPGMLTPWLSNEAFAAVIDAASAATGLDLRAHGTESDADTIRDTAIAQPLIVAAGLGSLAAAAALGLPISAADAVAGHSVGEITAAAATGVLSLEDALALVAVRGRAMAEAAAVVQTGMAAVLGGERDDVIATLTRHGLVAANENGAKQIVAAGTLEQIEALNAEPPAGARIRPLQVAGAFHTQFMASATDAVCQLSSSMATNNPSVQLISNRGGEIVTDGADVVARLVSQVSSPVRWDLCMETFQEIGVTGIVELFPGGTLTGIAKRALPGVELLAITAPEDLEKLSDFVSQHLHRVPSAPSESAEESK